MCTGEQNASQSKGTTKDGVVVVAPSDVVAPSHAATPTRVATATPTDVAVADSIHIEIEKMELMGVWEEDDKEAEKQQNMDMELCNRFYM